MLGWHKNALQDAALRDMPLHETVVRSSGRLVPVLSHRPWLRFTVRIGIVNRAAVARSPAATLAPWRFVYRRSDGTQTTKRGFASERAARDARRRLIEQVERGEVRHTKETFSGYWGRWLDRRRPYLEPGTCSGYEIAGRKRLLPAFERPLGELSVDAIRQFVAELAGLPRNYLRRDRPGSAWPSGAMIEFQQSRRCCCS